MTFVSFTNTVILDGNELRKSSTTSAAAAKLYPFSNVISASDWAFAGGAIGATMLIISTNGNRVCILTAGKKLWVEFVQTIVLYIDLLLLHV